MYAETSAKSREYISKRNYTDSFSLKVYGIEEETLMKRLKAHLLRAVQYR